MSVEGDQRTFATSVLAGLGIAPTAENMRAMVGWMRAEGGHWNNDATYNPLNTTQPEPGAGNTGTQGNIKVYTSWQQGVTATVATLNNGHYPTILAALRNGTAQDVATAIGSSPWGTSGALVSSVIASTPAQAASTGTLAGAAGGSSSGASSGALTSPAQHTTLVRFGLAAGLVVAAVVLIVVGVGRAAGVRSGIAAAAGAGK